MLCFTLGLVLMLLSRAKDPSAWTWLTDLDSRKQAASSPDEIANVNPVLVQNELPPGVFVAAARDLDPLPGNPQQDVPQREPMESTPAVAEIDPTVFEGIRDKTDMIPPRAYFHLLQIARRTPEQVLEQQAQRDLTFAHFAARPDLYRGQPVFLKGHVRRMTRLAVTANREGIEQLYEGWLFTEESQDNPYVIIVSRLPDDFPVGGNIVEDVSFAGYFLKLWAYRAGDGDRYAPLILGHRIVWHPRPAGFAPSGTTNLVILVAVALLIAILLSVGWYARRSALAIRRMHQSQSSRPAPDQIQAIGEMAAPSVDEFLANMKRQSDGENERESAND